MIKLLWNKIIAALSYVRYKNRFKEYHITDKLIKPIKITPQFISLGEFVEIGNHARIQGVKSYSSVKYNPSVRIEDGVNIQQNLHLTCANSIIIGRNTAIAANVTITDIHHPYDDINIPIERQQLVVKEVVIGEDCKIYNNAVILPGVHIGKHVTIGANSVVTRDIPSFSVAVGNPAKIIKSYDFKTESWVKLH